MPPGYPLSAEQRAALQDALEQFDPRDRRHGLRYLQQGRVRRVELDLERDSHAPAFSAVVQDAGRCDIEWFFNPASGWDHTCTCEAGSHCKHAYAVAKSILGDVSASSGFTLGSPPPSPSHAPLAPAARASPPPSDAQPLIDLLEQRHGRALAPNERAYVQSLRTLWRQQRGTCSIFAEELAPLALFPLSHKRGVEPVIADWWDADSVPSSLLEFWQYIALYAERTGLPLPPLLVPVTDTALVRTRVHIRERRHTIDNWQRLFTEDRTPAPLSPTRPVLPREIRLRLTAPKLTWEHRETTTDPWLPAKSDLAAQWIEALNANPLGADPATLALLQEVSLVRARQKYWGGTDAQSFKLTEESTLTLLHRLLEQPALRGRLVAENGADFPETRIPLCWHGRPLPDRPEDILFDLAQPDGSPAPENLLRLPGQPALAVAGAIVYSLPPPLPGPDPRRVVVPRESLSSLAAAKCLYRAAARLEGVALPNIEILTLRPRFVCSLSTSRAGLFGSQAECLRVEFHGVSPDGSLVQRRDNHGKWLTLRGTAASTAECLREVERQRAEAALPLLYEFNLSADFESHQWSRPADAKSFPDQFGTWAERVRSLGVEIECDPELAGLARPPDRARVAVSVKPGDEGTGIDWFDLEVAVRAEDTTLTDAELKLLLKAKGRFVKLAGKGWRRLALDLPPEELAKLGELGLDATALEGGPAQQRFHALQLADERIAGLLPEQHAARARARAAQLSTIAEPPVPAGLRAELRPYQREGFHFLAHLAANGLGGVLADDMGLGKTVQALAWLLHLAERGTAADAGAARPLRALVVCPKSVVPNWMNETKRFAPALSVASLEGAAGPAAANLVVVNYAQLRLAAATLGAETWDAVILDEGQNIKNPQSQTAQVARDLRTTHRIVLTGTPIENRALDLWSLFAFAMPGLLGTQASFKRTFNDKLDPAGARARLARRVKHFLLRRTKGQVAADLPSRSEEDLLVELDGPQRQLYDAELKRTRALLLGVTTARDFDQQRFNILQSLLRLRQICCDPRLVGYEEGKTRNAAKKNSAAAKEPPPASAPAEPPNAPAPVNPEACDTGSAKLDALLDTIEPLIEEGHRVLVFSQFVTMLGLIAAELKARSIGYLLLTGQTENRQALVDRFQSAEGESVFLLSLKAAGSGLNLTAASYVVLFDPWWNPAVEAQAIDRTHRIGQKEQVIAYRVIARDTIEEKIRLLQRAKADLARSIVQEESLSTVMSLDDLRFVLGSGNEAH
ncbi:MAG: hypothetical protein IPL39_14090 [Opitutaceae bacterium]|nr:hypothetical protein [Opitutaceae bacterium]